VPDSEEISTFTSVVEITNRSIRLLCRGLLTEPGVKASIATGLAPDFFRNLTETELLARLWTADFDPGNAASVNAFIGRLPEGERQAVLRLLSEESAAVTPNLARECLAALKRQSIQRQISVTKAQMGAPGLPEYEVTRLAKVLLDLRGLLNES
jgi:hypothetical protein